MSLRDSVDDEVKYLRAQKSRYEARNAEYNARYYAVQNRGLESRYRGSNRYGKLSTKHQYPRSFPGRN